MPNPKNSDGAFAQDMAGLLSIAEARMLRLLDNRHGWWTLFGRVHRGVQPVSVFPPSFFGGATFVVLRRDTAESLVVNGCAKKRVGDGAVKMTAYGRAVAAYL